MPPTIHPVSSYLLLAAGALAMLAALLHLTGISFGKAASSSGVSRFLGAFTATTSGDVRVIFKRMCFVDAAYILIGFACGGADGSAGAAVQLVYVGAARLLAWLALSRLIDKANTSDLTLMRGVGRTRRVTATLYAFGMFMALGVSPFLTPDAKPFIMYAAIASNLWIPTILMVAANAIMAVYTIRMVHGIWLARGSNFIREPEDVYSPHLYPCFALTALLALMGIFGHSIMNFAALITGANASALPDFTVNWHTSALIPYIGAFAVWGYCRINRKHAVMAVPVIMGIAFLFALLGSDLTPLSRLYAVAVTGIGLMVGMYSYGYIRPRRGSGKATTSRYYFFFLILFGSLAGIATAKNLGSLFVFWELMTLSSYVLVAYENSKKAHAAAVRYYVMCTVAAAFLLPALLMLGATLGTLDMALIAERSGAIAPGLACLIALLALVGYGVKAGLVPGHSWLPVAHPAAPSSISAPLSGVLTKAGIFGLAQLLFGLMGMGVLLGEGEAGIPGIGIVITILGTITMLYGEWMALKQKDIKALFAYSTMGQVGEMTLTLGLCSYLAASGVLMHLINHAVMKDLLFLGSGIFIMAANNHRTLDDLKGLGRALPVTATCMVIGLLSIMGLPPFAGFMSKFAMLYAIADQSVFLAILLLLAGMAGCIYYTRIIRVLIFEPYTGLSLDESVEAPLSMRAPVIILAGLCIVLGLFPELNLALVTPVLETFTASGKLAPQALPSLAIAWQPYTLLLMLGAAVPFYLRHSPELAGRATAFVLAAAAFAVILFGQNLDGISFWFAFLVPAVGAINMHYASGYMSHSHTQWRFYAFFLFMAAGLTGVAASSDLFNFFLFWEIMSSWSLYFVIVHEESAEALREGFKYFFFNVMGAGFLFLGVVLLINWSGGAEFSRIAEALPTLSGGRIALAVFFMATGFVMKAAQLPFRIDIQMHPASAPTPVSGYISSVLLKSAIVGLIKLFLALGGGLAAVSALSWFGQPEIMTLTLWIGGITIVMAGVFAVFQNDIKLILIYSTVSQLGYMVVGAALGTSLGVAGGLLHLVNHMLFKDLLFLVAGAVIFRTHTQSTDRMGGLAANMPKTFAFFIIGALCVIGVPPSNGFTSKWIIYHALMEEGHAVIAVLSLVGSVITLAYFAKFMHVVFLGAPAPGLEKVQEAPRSMVLPMAILASGCVLTSIFPGVILAPINTILGELSLAPLDVAPWGLASGKGSWNATAVAVLFAAAIACSWLALKYASAKRRVSPIHTCGVDPADLNPHTLSRDIYSAPADALKKLGRDLRSLKDFRFSLPRIKRGPGNQR